MAAKTPGIAELHRTIETPKRTYTTALHNQFVMTDSQPRGAGEHSVAQDSIEKHSAAQYSAA